MQTGSASRIKTLFRVSSSARRERSSLVSVSIKPSGLRARWYKALSAAVVCALALSAIATRAEKVEQLKPQGYVDDFAGVLNPSYRATHFALLRTRPQGPRPGRGGDHQIPRRPSHRRLREPSLKTLGSGLQGGRPRSPAPAGGK